MRVPVIAVGKRTMAQAAREDWTWRLDQTTKPKRTPVVDGTYEGPPSHR